MKSSTANATAKVLPNGKKTKGNLYVLAYAYLFFTARIPLFLVSSKNPLLFKIKRFRPKIYSNSQVRTFARTD